LLAAFVRGFAQKVKTEICPMQVFVERSRYAANSPILANTFLGCLIFFEASINNQGIP
jgi:hypothetical protein